MTKYNIVIYDTAYYDIDDIYNFCCNVSTRYATKIKNNISESTHMLKYFPYAHPIHIVLENLVFRKKIVNSRYLIIYLILKNSVFIYRVYDNRRNIQPNDLFNIN